MIFALQVIAAVLVGVAAFIPQVEPARLRLVAGGLLAFIGSFLVSSYPG